MASKFDWRAEDDDRWDEFASDDPHDEQPNPNGKRPTWLIVLGVFVVMMVVGLFGYFQLRRYVNNTTASVEEDVLSSHALVKRAAQEGDLEIFAPLLSGRDPNWTQDQLALLDMNLLIDRQPFGLTWRPEETAEDISVELSPDLQSAEIEYVETYGYGLGGAEDVIQLTQSAVYRLSETRWLLSPPDNDFWGNRISSKGRYITLTYPERDEEIGGRLASDLESALAGACRTLELGCDQPWPLDVLLTADGDAWAEIGVGEIFVPDGGPVTLPTPTLVGKPANEASYRALYRGYAKFLISHLIARQVNWQCCDHSPYFNALVDVQLRQLGFLTWPVTAETYSEAFRQPDLLASVRSIWMDGVTMGELQERPDRWIPHLFVEFLLAQQEELSAIELERELVQNSSIDLWLSAVGVTGNLTLIREDWQLFIRDRISQTQSDQPPIGWPEEDIALVCNDGQMGIANIYRYATGEARWSVELGDRDFVVMTGLPNNAGLLLIEQYLDVDKYRTTLWRDGQETVVSYGDAVYFSEQRSDPSGRYLALTSFEQNTDSEVDFASQSYVLDLENCQDESCPLLPGGVRPIWSPDGSRTIWIRNDPQSVASGEEQIYVGDAQLQGGELVTTGIDPFWVDNEHYAFFMSLFDKTLMVGSIDGQPSEQVLETADLAALLPELLPVGFEIIDAGAAPNAPGLIYVTAINRPADQGYLFSLDWQSGELKLVFTDEQSVGNLNIHSFSPDNRWLALLMFANSGSSTQSYQVTVQLVFMAKYSGLTIS